MKLVGGWLSLVGAAVLSWYSDTGIMATAAALKSHWRKVSSTDNLQARCQSLSACESRTYKAVYTTNRVCAGL